MVNVRAGIKGFVSRPIEERFWEYVDKSGECWVWTGTKRHIANSELGYGMIWDSSVKRNRPATQVAWEIANGRPFPAGMDACHHCDNPPCVRAEHIFPGTASDNAKDAQAKGRLFNPQSIKTHCPQGHDFTAENTYITSVGGRACKECQRQYTRAWRSRARAALEGTAEKASKEGESKVWAVDDPDRPNRQPLHPNDGGR